MLKLIIKTAVPNTPETDPASIFINTYDSGACPYFMVTHTRAQTSYARLTGPLSRQDTAPLEDLTKLLLMHPCFRRSTSLVDYIYTDMLDLIGLDTSTVTQVSDSFNKSEVMVVSLESTDKKNHCFMPPNLRVTGYFEIKLHNQFKSLIRKALVNLVQMPGLRWERQVIA